MIGSPVTMAITAMTVMLWIIWSDTIRARRPSVVLYSVRVLLFLVMSGLLVSGIYQRPWMHNTSTRALTFVAAGIGVLGAAYFAYRIIKRR